MAAARALRDRWAQWKPDVPLVLLAATDEQGRPSRVLSPALARYVNDVAGAGEEHVILLIGEVAPNHWWQQVLFNRRGAVVARYLGRHSNAVVCRFRFRLLPRAARPTGRRRTLRLPATRSDGG